MYIFQLMGGLGNQMFQYAAGKSLSDKTGIEFSIDFDCPYRHIKYRYNLDVFKLKVKSASAADIWKSKPKTKVLKRLFMMTGKDYNCKLVTEKKDFVFDPEFFGIEDGSYVRGFWQSEKYFKDIANTIREDFSFVSEPEGRNKEFADQIASSQSVSLHIRRGDYVKVAETNSLHGVCSISYYKQAINILSEKIQNPVFFIFSDDMDWVKENFSIQAEHYYVDENNAATNFEDLRLMSLCRHNIIANSSFSWWGAWLNASKSKIVVAPKQWMNDPSFETPDLIPASWIRL